MAWGNLKGRRIVISGCSKGNGLALSQVLVEQGANVVGFSRRMSQEAIKEVNDSGPGSFTWRKLDVSNREKVQERIDEAAELLGGIDVVVCCQFIYWEKTCMELTREDFDTIFDVDFFGTVNMNQCAFPYLKESKGTILNYGSGAGTTTKTVGSDPAHYCAAKGALHMWTRKIASEWGQYGITANAICPMVWTTAVDDAINTPEKMEWFKGRVNEHMHLSDTYFEGRYANGLHSKKVVAPYVAFLCTEDAKYITGQVLNVDGGMVENR